MSHYLMMLQRLVSKEVVGVLFPTIILELIQLQEWTVLLENVILFGL